MLTKRVWVGAAGAVALAALALVVGTAESATVHVEIKNFAFAPQNITVEVGDTVVWTNNDTTAHDVTFQAGFDSGGPGSLAAGGDFSHTFDAAGSFPYRCTLHSSDFTAGMIGAVSVRAPVPASDHYVEMKNAVFTDAEIHIEPGESVTWINNETFAHDILFEDGFGSGGPASMAAGATYTHTFAENGTFQYRCQVHSVNFDSGMVGVVIVGDGEQPETPPPPAPSPGFEASIVALGLVGALLLAGLGRRRR